MKRILQIGMHDKIGGVETFLMNYYRNINKNNIQFDFINMYDELCFEKEIKDLGGQVYKVSNVKKRPIKYYKTIKKIIKDNNYNTVHINMLSLANALPVLAAKKAGAERIIVHSHNTGVPNGLLRKILNKVNKRIVLNNATDFWACSQLAGDWMFGKDISNTSKMTIIKNAVDAEKYQYNNEISTELKKKMKLENNFVVGNIGRFEYQKNHEFLIDIFYEIKKVKDNAVLLLIGEGELKADIEQKVRDLKLIDSVIFLGTTNEIYKYLQIMDVFILTSRFEGLPVTGIEAQTSGVECFFSDAITKELKINSNVYFIPLDEGAKKWSEIIITSKHERNTEKMKEYNIKDMAIFLENMYMQ